MSSSFGSSAAILVLGTWVVVCCLVAKSCLTLCNPMYCSLSGSSIQGIFQVRMLELGCHFLLQGIFLTQGSFPALADRSFTTESPGKPLAHSSCLTNKWKNKQQGYKSEEIRWSHISDLAIRKCINMLYLCVIRFQKKNLCVRIDSIQQCRISYLETRQGKSKLNQEWDKKLRW